jgi:hypothetical protein
VGADNRRMLAVVETVTPAELRGGRGFPKGLFGRWRIQVDRRGFWKILTYNGNSSTPIPFIPGRSTDSQTSPKSPWQRLWVALPVT